MQAALKTAVSSKIYHFLDAPRQFEYGAGIMKLNLTKIISGVLLISINAPSLAMAYDAETFTEISNQGLIQGKMLEIFNDLSESDRAGVIDQLKTGLAQADTMLSQVSEEDITAVASNSANVHLSVAGKLDSVQEKNPALNTHTFKSFIKAFRRHISKSNRKATPEEIGLQKKELHEKIKFLNGTLSKGTEAKVGAVVLNILAALGDVIWIYFVLYAVGTWIGEFLMVIFGGLLGVFGVYLGLFLALAVGLGMVMLPALLIQGIKNGKALKMARH